MIEFDTRYSRRVLLRILLMLVAAVALVTGGMGFVDTVYLRNQLTEAGLVINGAILVLFLLGLGRLVAILLRYAREEAALAKVVHSIEEERPDPTVGANPDSIAVERYQVVQRLARQSAPINHAALASMLVATESTRLSFPKFINNILILTGVFGTIVSLSIALVGASDLLDSAQGLGNMGLVIHGMSTALSTTITAIVCYVIYGYFYLKLIDARTHLLNGVEQFTSLYLLPRFSHDRDSMLHQLVTLIRSLQQLADAMKQTQDNYGEAAEQIRDSVAGVSSELAGLDSRLVRLEAILRQGFRLPSEEV